MANDYYTRDKSFTAGTKAKGSDVKSELDLIATGLDKLPSQARMDSGNTNYVVAGGTANALTITSPGTAITTYTGQDGLTFSVKATGTSTGSTTVNVDNAGPVGLVVTNGSDPIAGGISVNGIYTLTYNETTGKFYFADEASAAISAAAAAASAAGVNMPPIASGDALKLLRANSSETAFELVSTEDAALAQAQATALSF